MGTARISIEHSETIADMTAIIQESNESNFVDQCTKVSAYFNSLVATIRKATVTVTVGELAASGTLTCASVVATNSCVINGVTFTAVASGATGNQFNVGGSDTLTAAALAASINSSATSLVSGYVTATSALGVVTVAALSPGKEGNEYTLAGGTNITASGARLTAGSDGTEKVFHIGT